MEIWGRATFRWRGRARNRQVVFFFADSSKKLSGFKFSVAVVQQKYSVFWAWMKRNIVILYHEMYANRFFVWNFLFQTYYRFEPNNGFQDTWNLFEKYMLFPRCVEEVLELLCFIFFIYFIFLFQVWAWQRPDRVPRCVGQVLELHLGWSTMR